MTGWLMLSSGMIFMATGIVALVFGGYWGGQDLGWRGFVCAVGLGIGLILLSYFLIGNGLQLVDPVLSWRWRMK